MSSQELLTYWFDQNGQLQYGEQTREVSFPVGDMRMEFIIPEIDPGHRCRLTLNPITVNTNGGAPSIDHLIDLIILNEDNKPRGSRVLNTGRTFNWSWGPAKSGEKWAFVALTQFIGLGPNPGFTILRANGTLKVEQVSN